MMLMMVMMACALPHARVHMCRPGTDGHFDLWRLEALPGEQLDKMATRVLRGMLAVGALDEDVCTAGCDCEPYMYGANATSSSHVSLARTIGAQSAVLLKNDERTLPIAPSSIVAIVGSACDAPHSIDPESDAWDVGIYNQGLQPSRVSNHLHSVHQSLSPSSIIKASNPRGSVLID